MRQNRMALLVVGTLLVGVLLGAHALGRAPCARGARGAPPRSTPRAARRHATPRLGLGTLLSITNPVLLFLERKIWAQSVLPIFMVALLLGWMRRDTRVGAFAWGLLGAVIGQIHMAGFFFAPALAAWTKLFGARTRWGAWVAGSVRRDLRRAMQWQS